MKANELRIGNLVYSLETNDVQKIIGINEEYISIDTVTFDYLSYDEITPIPLTEEWLLKFGFKYNKGFDIYQKDDFIIRRKDFVLCNIDIEVKFEYVHRLQNAYFELKNKELCYNFVITK